jgi:hypothetical protein
MAEKPGRRFVITPTAVDRDVHVSDVRAAPSRASAGYTAVRVSPHQPKRS